MLHQKPSPLKSFHAVITNHPVVSTSMKYVILSCDSSDTQFNKIPFCSLYKNKPLHCVMCFFRFETQWNPFPRDPHSWTTLQCHIRHHINWNPFMQNPQIWTILWPISCHSRNTISTEILSSRNLQILKPLKSPRAASTNNNQSLILLMCFIHKNGPVPYLSQFLHQILNAPKIFSCSIHNYEPDTKSIEIS